MSRPERGPYCTESNCINLLDKYIRTFRLALPTFSSSHLFLYPNSLKLQYSKTLPSFSLSEFVKIVPTSAPSKTMSPPLEMFLSLLSRSLSPTVLKESNFEESTCSQGINFPKKSPSSPALSLHSLTAP